jgi:SAM-dependent methyltransferase
MLDLIKPPMLKREDRASKTSHAPDRKPGGARVSAQYNVARPGSLPMRIAGYQRRKVFDAFTGLGIATHDTILDIGATSDQSYDHSNYLAAWYPHKDRITAVGIDDASHLEKLYPGLTFIRANGLALPFQDKSFDYVHAAAVIEHVGNRSAQTHLIREAIRVARKCALITTPNRWFPVEFHTVLPLIHWLPPRLFRQLLRAIGREFFAREENLNLLSASDVRRMAGDIGLEFELRGVRLLGLTSNLLLIVRSIPC